ncbi:MAG: hypothetical protein ABIH04_06610, partial [Planctomycetota bacterium]
MAKRVLFLVINEAEKDPRVFRHARELVARGFDVLCLGWTKAAKSSSLEVEGVKIRNLCSGDISVDPRKFFSRYKGSNEVAGVLAEPVLEELAPDFWQRVRAVARKHAPFLRGPWEVLKKLKNGSGGAIDPETAAAAERESKNDILYMMGINEGMIVASRDINDIDVIVGNDANTLLASAVIKARTGAGLCYDAHEIFHRQYAEGVRSPFWEDFYRNLESALLKITDCRFTVNRSIADWM